MVAGMVMPLADLRAIYELLFRDGVMVAKKDKRPQCMHPELQGVANLKVIRAMGSLKSKGFVRETFAWKHAYYYLTNEGIVYLREYLRLPPEIVPSSLQRVRRPASTLDVMRRAARVQTVDGPTSYVPKPRAGGESQEAMMDRQGYRHKRAGEEEGQSERPPMRFRGSYQPRAPAGEPGVQTQTFFRRGQGFRRGEERVAEEGQRRGFRNNYAPPESRAVRSPVPVREAKPPTPVPVAAPVVAEILEEVALPVVQQVVEPDLPPAFIPAVEPEAPPPSPPAQEVIEDVEEDVVGVEEEEAEVVEEVAAEAPAAVEEPEPVTEAVVEEEEAALEEKETVIEEESVVEEEPVAEELAVAEEVAVAEEEAVAEEVAVVEEEEAAVEEEEAIIEEPVAVEEEEAIVKEPAAVEEEEAIVEEPAAVEPAAVEEEEAIVEEPAVEVITEPVLEEPVEAVAEEVIEATPTEQVEEEPKPASVGEESSSEEEEDEDDEEEDEEEEDVVEEDTPAEVAVVEDGPEGVPHDGEIEVLEEPKELVDGVAEASVPLTKAMTPEPDSDLDMPTPPPPVAEDFTDLTEEVERVTIPREIDGANIYTTSQEVVTVVEQAPETQVISQSHSVIETAVQMVTDIVSEFGLEQEKTAAFEADFAAPVVPSDCPIAALKSSLPQGDWGFLTEDPEEEQEVKKVWPDSVEG